MSFNITITSDNCTNGRLQTGYRLRRRSEAILLIILENVQSCLLPCLSQCHVKITKRNVPCLVSNEVGDTPGPPSLNHARE